MPSTTIIKNISILQIPKTHQTAIAQNRECLQKHQQKMHELIDYLIGVKPLEFPSAIHYKRTSEDEQRLLWALKTIRKNVIEPLQQEYQQLMVVHEKTEEAKEYE